jgi:hypothetical protein
MRVIVAPLEVRGRSSSTGRAAAPQPAALGPRAEAAALGGAHLLQATVSAEAALLAYEFPFRHASFPGANKARIEVPLSSLAGLKAAPRQGRLLLQLCAPAQVFVGEQAAAQVKKCHPASGRMCTLACALATHTTPAPLAPLEPLLSRCALPVQAGSLQHGCRFSTCQADFSGGVVPRHKVHSIRWAGWAGWAACWGLERWASPRRGCAGTGARPAGSWAAGRCVCAMQPACLRLPPRLPRAPGPMPPTPRAPLLHRHMQVQGDARPGRPPGAADQRQPSGRAAPAAQQGQGRRQRAVCAAGAECSGAGGAERCAAGPCKAMEAAHGV